MVTVEGLNASTVVLDSPSQITATFDLGVPVTGGEIEPTVFFFHLSGAVHFAKNEETISNPIQVTSSSSGLECSFSGGCQYKIAAMGLASVAKQVPEENYL
mmetsp:Transcript_20898/g.32327  ORF Transcript_20898/g.32327 Transcript_20898/m.32327 type:complete len:101 (-) Transcript_20898:1852-2154(-)